MNKLPWKILLKQAIRLIEDTGFKTKRWTLGGGTVLRQYYKHRISNDIDIFFTDPQIFSYFNPELNDSIIELTGKYRETTQSLKLHLVDGDIDLILSKYLTNVDQEIFEFEGRRIQMEPAAEIAAKKVHYRAEEFTIRDLFDLACIIKNNSRDLSRPDVKKYFVNKADVLRKRFHTLIPVYEAKANREIDVLEAGKPILKSAPKIVGSYLNNLN
ncbi:MAG: nucleotidyl transferase AbiEii/AbiGii toxin family protein [bacterium]